MQKFCLALDLIEDEAMIQEYETHHAPGNAWPEVTQHDIDAGILKTIILPDESPFFQFRELYLMAWRYGLKGLSSFRPNPDRDTVLLR